MKYATLLLLLVQLIGLPAFAQEVFLENEETNSAFNKEHKLAKPRYLYGQEDGNIIGLYENVGRRNSTEIIFRKFSPKLRALKKTIQELPEDASISDFHQFKDGSMIALMYVEKEKKKVALYVVPFNKERMKLDMKTKSLVGTYELGRGAMSRRAARFGYLFQTIGNENSNFIALIGDESVKRSEAKEVNYVIINSAGKVENQGKYKFKEDLKRISVEYWNITSTGNLYGLYESFEDDKRAGGDSYIVNLVTGKRDKIGKTTKAVSDASMVPQEDGMLIFGTYSETRQDRIRGRVQGTYLATFDESTGEVKKEVFTEFTKDVLNKIFDGKKGKVKRGNVASSYKVRFLRESSKNIFKFAIEPNYSITYTTQNGSYTVFYAEDVIAGSINAETNKYEWVDVIQKAEAVKNTNAVGSFPFLDDENNLCILFNVNRTKDVSRTESIKYKHTRPASAEMTIIKFDENGKSKEVELMKARKETSFYYRSDHAMRDLYNRQSYLILIKRSKEMIALLK